MLRFNNLEKAVSISTAVFQYILCYGSTLSDVEVSEDSIKFQYILCYGSTAKEEKPVILLLEFQYILCYGSTQIKFGVIKKHM